MSDRASRLLTPLLLGLLLGASLLSVQPAQSFPVSDGQQDETEDVLGEGAPFGAWEPRTSTNTFYLHSGPTGGGTPPVQYTPGPAVPDPVLDVIPPDPDATQSAPSDIPRSQVPDANNGKQAAIGERVGGPVRFPFAGDLTALDDYQVYGFSTTVWAACTVGNLGTVTTPVATATPVGITALVILQHQVGGNWTDKATLTEVALTKGVTYPTQATRWSGTSTIGDAIRGTGPVVKPGERLLVQYEARAPNDAEAVCILYYDGFFPDPNDGSPRYSFVTFTSNALRVALYTADPTDDPEAGGERRTAFPSAGLADAQGRRLAVEALQAHAMGPGMAEQLINQKHANVRLFDLSNNRYVYYVDNSAGGFPREFETEDFRLVSGRSTNLVPEPDIEVHLGHGVVRRSYVFSYNATQPDIVLRPEFYSFSDPWVLLGSQVALGGKGIAFRLLPGEQATHLVNPREATEFAFEVVNTGTTDDVVSVSVSEPGGGWSARVLGGGLFSLAPGRTAVGVVELVPPPNAVAGATRTVTVRASSSFSDVEDPEPIAFTARVVSQVVRDVELSAVDTVLKVRAGETKGFGVVLANEGTARNSFVLVPSLTTDVQGWTITTAPASLQLPAGGRSVVQVLVRAPAEVPTGTLVPLGLVATEVGNASVSDRLDLTLDVVSVSGILGSLLDPGVNRTLRLPGPDCIGDPLGICFGIGEVFPDNDFDRNGVGRFVLTNPGDRPLRAKVEAYWDLSGGGFTDSNLCEFRTQALGFPSPIGSRSSDGVPDGWRFNYASGVGDTTPGADGGVPPARNAASPLGSEMTPTTPRQRGIQAYNNGFSGYVQLNTSENPLVVPAHSSVPLHFEVGYISGPDACPGNALDPEVNENDPFSPKATLAVRMSSLDTPSESTVRRVTMVRQDAGTFLGSERYSGATHSVLVEPAPGAESTRTAAPGATTVFDVVAVNRGNEKDDLRITLAGASDWAHRLSVVESVPPGRLCDLPDPADPLTVVCRDLGVYDEVRLQVLATPGNDVRVGERDPITVTVASGDAPGIARTLGLTARLTGTHDFTVAPRGATTRTVAPGQTVSFPFEVANDGTAADSYRFSVLRGDVGAWSAALSTGAPVFVPAGHETAAFFTVRAPAGAAVGTTDVFRVQVESLGDGTKKTFEVSPVVQAASALAVAGAEGQDVLVAQRLVETPINVTAVQLSGSPVSSITFRADQASLPSGWTLDRTQATASPQVDSSGRPTATVTFKVKAPADALGTSRGLLRVEALSGTMRAATDITLNLASTFGIDLATDGNATQVVAPGGSVVYNLTLANLGLGPDTVRLTSTALPAGWTLVFTPASAALGPLETLDVVAKLSAPVTAQPGDVATLVAFAASLTDPTQTDSLALAARVGFHDVRLAPVTTAVPRGAPQETVAFVVNVTNAGTLPDQVRLVPALDTTSARRLVNLTADPPLVSLDPGETAQVRVLLGLGDSVPSNSTVVSTLAATSLLDERTPASSAQATLTARVLPYAFADPNGDGRRDYAVDRNGDATDGFEEFKASATPGGRPLSSANLEAFLRDDAREALSRDVTLPNGTLVRVLALEIDGDSDRRRDHFLDGDGDGQPDYYWDPDANRASPIEFRKDVNGDQVPESFVDTDGDGSVDAVYDLTRGRFTDVVQVDVDGDGQLDYVVDRDGDGQVDQDETVLYTRTGQLLIVQKVDVDGDNRLDQVYDVQGDGTPDYFIPSGSTQSVPILMRDVTGDGVLDWTFDGDNDGRRESYYDPTTGKAHVIDAAGHFGDALREYWYIGVLFALVVVLFAALVVVTRR